MNSGSSFYHAIGALFCRGPDGELLSIEGRYADPIANHWPELRNLMNDNVRTCTILASEAAICTTSINTSKVKNLQICGGSSNHPHTVRELYRAQGNYHVGLVSCDTFDDTQGEKSFCNWLETFILLETSLRPGIPNSNSQDPQALQITGIITSLFEESLKNIASKDEWDTGVNLFRRRILEFVVRDERIQMALPAFPCKSPNLRKVGGLNPDMAERVALRTLQRFAQDVRAIYSPGVAIWIISDGHVFADCIGVDDEAVGNYDQALASGYRRMYTSPEDHEAIRFRGLTDIFFSNPDSLDNFNHKWADSFHVDHPIHSRRLPEAELARQIMMTGFQSSRDHFRKLIAEQHPPTLSLYRGQARFMQDDLTDPTFLAMSGKQRKKLSFTVAAEMIARNQAYSNLLELLLPNYVRLSIHAHSNRGPKFGICLFPRNQVHAIEAVMNRHALCPSYEFQVPTPWHNSIIKVDGDSVLYLGKAEIVQKAIEQGDFEGGWVQDVVQGGYFVLRSTSTVCEAPSAATDLSSASTIYTNFEKEKFSRAEHETVEMVVTRPSHDELGIRFAVRLRAKVCRALKLSRRFIDRLTKDTIRLRSSKREVAANPC